LIEGAAAHPGMLGAGRVMPRRVVVHLGRSCARKSFN
jgi:hypothetical protein